MDKRSPPSFRFDIGREHRGNPQGPLVRGGILPDTPIGPCAAPKQRSRNKIPHLHNSRNPCVIRKNPARARRDCSDKGRPVTSGTRHSRSRRK